MTKFIVTNIKFAAHSVSGKTVSFITKEHDAWKGVREFDPRKKIIVLPDLELQSKLEHGVLYRCRLVPMSNRLGYVAVSATKVLFPATVETEMFATQYRVKVKFGNQTVVYDPSHQDPQRNDFHKVLNRLKSCQCIKNMGETIEEFTNSVNTAAANYA